MANFKTGKINKTAIISFTIMSLIALSALTGCHNYSESSEVSVLFDNDSTLVSEIKYADGFDIYTKDGITKLVIYNPQNITEVLHNYYFTTIGEENNNEIISIPVDSVAVFSATQLNAFSKLGLLQHVCAISESDYIRNEEVRRLYNKGDIVNLASKGNFFLEKTLKVNPRIIFYSPYNFGQRHPLAETQITMIPFFDFMESNPLGRAEWIKFTALFFDKNIEADIIFDSIENSYLTYKHLVTEVKKRPTVFSDKYYSGQWFVPGGQSYIAQLFKDSGADYIWSENTNTASFNVDFEVVYDKAHMADFWRIVGSYEDGFTYEKLGDENPLYRNFDAFINHRVIFCDSKSSTYFETGTLEPHIILADLIFAFHPELLPGYEPVYYKLYH